MPLIDMDETTEIGQQILRETADNPKAGKVKAFKIPRDENGNAIGTPWKEVLDNLYNDLSGHYGIDLRKL
jgi:hypothetical protein